MERPTDKSHSGLFSHAIFRSSNSQNGRRVSERMSNMPNFDDLGIDISLSSLLLDQSDSSLATTDNNEATKSGAPTRPRSSSSSVDPGSFSRNSTVSQYSHVMSFDNARKGDLPFSFAEARRATKENWDQLVGYSQQQQRTDDTAIEGEFKNSWSLVFKNFSRPFVDYKMAQSVGWTMKFPKPLEEQYNTFYRGAARVNYNIAIVYWFCTMLFCYIIVETGAFRSARIVQNYSLDDLRTTYVVQLGTIILLALLQLWKPMSRKYIYGLCYALALSAATTVVVIHYFLDGDIPNLLLFPLVPLVYSLLLVRYVFAVCIVLSVTIATLVIDVVYLESENHMKLVIANVFIYLCINILGAFYAYCKELYNRRFYLKSLAIAHAQKAIVVEIRKSDALLVSLLPPSIISHLKQVYHQARLGKQKPSTTTAPSTVSTPSFMASDPKVLQDTFSYSSNYFAQAITDPAHLFREHTIIPQRQITILFADIVGFTRLCSTMSPERLVELLNYIFSEFDLLSDKYHIEKIKTLGDCYMACAGLNDTTRTAADRAVLMAMEMVVKLNQVNAMLGTRLRVRIGLHTGDVLTGVMGASKFVFDVWSDDVLIAAQMEQLGLPNRVHLSEATRNAMVTAKDFTFSEVRSMNVALTTSNLGLYGSMDFDFNSQREPSENPQDSMNDVHRKDSQETMADVDDEDPHRSHPLSASVPSSRRPSSLHSLKTSGLDHQRHCEMKGYFLDETFDEAKSTLLLKKLEKRRDRTLDRRRQQQQLHSDRQGRLDSAGSPTAESPSLSVGDPALSTSAPWNSQDGNLNASQSTQSFTPVESTDHAHQPRVAANSGPFDSFVIVDQEMYTEQSTEGMVRDISAYITKLGHEHMHPLWLTFRNPDMEAEYTKRKIRGHLGWFSAHIMQLFLIYLVQLIMELLVFGADWNTMIDIFSLSVVLFFGLVAVIIWFYETRAAMRQKARQLWKRHLQERENMDETQRHETGKQETDAEDEDVDPIKSMKDRLGQRKDRSSSELDHDKMIHEDTDEDTIDLGYPTAMRDRHSRYARRQTVNDLMNVHHSNRQIDRPRMELRRSSMFSRADSTASQNTFSPYQVRDKYAEEDLEDDDEESANAGVNNKSDPSRFPSYSSNFSVSQSLYRKAFVQTKGCFLRSLDATGKFLAPYYHMHVAAVLSLGLMFVSMMVDMLEESNSIFIVEGILLILLVCMNFTRLRACVMSSCALLFTIIFFVVPAIDGFTKFHLPELTVPLTIMLLCVVVYVNRRGEMHLRLDFLQRHALKEQVKHIAALRRDSERVLLNLLPAPVIRRLKENPKNVMAERLNDVTICFASVANFSQVVDKMKWDSTYSARILNNIICEFDVLTRTFGLEKIKTMGHTYMVVAGLGSENAVKSARTAALYAIALKECLAQKINTKYDVDLILHVGMNTGSCVGGVIGRHKFSFDLWGDTVNVASRMQTTSLADKIQMTENTANLLAMDSPNNVEFSEENGDAADDIEKASKLKVSSLVAFPTLLLMADENEVDHWIDIPDFEFDIVCRGDVEIKGKGSMKVFVLKGLKNRRSQDENP